ncbi:hypothetical protein [Micromonospora sp. MH99]|uniref:hypothetical protein n=1 Tax=Micromonospora sp. MH99 TaxID=1945510 RepID=UPI001F459F1D|nr:hypothetical protein [Micromonospora sp. MH99]
MVAVTRGGVTLSVVTVLAGPLLAAAPAHAAPAAGGPVAAASVLAAPAALVSAGLVPVAGPLVFAAAAPGGQPESQPGGAPQPGPVDVFVEVSPSTVQPGYLVGIRASCRDNSVGATVVSDAFGAVGVQPQRGVLTAAPMVRERTRPGNYRVKLECRDGETASTMLQVVKKVPSPQPSRGPATGFGGTSGGMTGKLLLPGGAALTITGLILAVVAMRRPRAVRGVARR